jgi:hypothetical protein
MNRPLPPIQKFLIAGLILAFVAFFADLLFDHTMHYISYFLSVLFLFGGMQTIVMNVTQVREAHRQGQNAVWHQQPELLVGIVVLFGAFYLFIFAVANTPLLFPKAKIVLTILEIISIIPLILLIRAGFFSVKRRRERNRGQE